VQNSAPRFRRTLRIAAPILAAMIVGCGRTDGGGDGSNGGTGTFFEGAMTSGNPSDATDAAIQANIAAAGYGR
jgi:Alpha-L-arabinofuranosidase B, catalytic